jgi:hypothetical protein
LTESAIPSENELSILTALKNLGGVDLAVSDLLDYLPKFMTSNRRNISSRLCTMRSKGWCTSEMVDSKNHWTLTDAGAAALNPVPESSDRAAVIEDEAPEPVTMTTIAGCGIDYSFTEKTTRDWLQIEADMLKTTPPKMGRTDDALFVLTTLRDHPLLDGMGHFQAELQRIADWLEAE